MINSTNWFWWLPKTRRKHLKPTKKNNNYKTTTNWRVLAPTSTTTLLSESNGLYSNYINQKQRPFTPLSSHNSNKNYLRNLILIGLFICTTLIICILIYLLTPLLNNKNNNSHFLKNEEKFAIKNLTGNLRIYKYL